MMKAPEFSKYDLEEIDKAIQPTGFFIGPSNSNFDRICYALLVVAKIYIRKVIKASDK